MFLRNGKTGSNIAEYLALIDGLETLHDLRIKNERLEVRGDAKCVIDQMVGNAGVTSSLTVQFNRRARKAAKHFTNVHWVWVPRRENRHADRLSRRSFRYMPFSPHLDRQINRSRFPASYGGQLIPLVDLRVHTPTTKALEN